MYFIMGQVRSGLLLMIRVGSGIDLVKIALTERFVLSFAGAGLGQVCKLGLCRYRL